MEGRLSYTIGLPALEDRRGLGGIARLPDELLLHIFGYNADLDGDPPSVSHILFEPSDEFTRREYQPLKTLSLVCPRWRRILFPDVFRCSRVNMSKEPRWLCLCSSHEEEIMDLKYVEEDDSHLLSLPNEYLHWLPSMRGEVATFIEFVKENGLQADIKSLVLQADQEMTPHPTAIERATIIQEANLLWMTFMDTFSLGRLVIAAPPSTMAALTSTRDSPESWTFEMPLHYLCFCLDAWKTKGPASPSHPEFQGSNTPSTSPTRCVQERPHNIRPWTKLTYNEGTMLPGYAHYEWTFNRPPFVLPILLNVIRHDLSHESYPNITSLTYISNFPFSDHVKEVAEQLKHFKHLKEVKIKFAEPNFLDDGNERLGRGQMSDVWKEWEDSYKNIIHHFLEPATPGTSVEFLDTVHTRLFEDVDRIMKDKSLVMLGPMAGQSFLQTEILGEGGERRGRWVKRDASGKL